MPTNPKGVPTVQVGADEKKELTVYSSPRERFQSNSANIRAHQEMVDDDSFDRGADAAMAQLASELADKSTDPNAAMGVGFMLRGAVMFLNRFKSIGELSKPPVKRPDPDNLQPTDQPKRT